MPTPTSSISQLMGSTTKPSSGSSDLLGWKWQVLRKRREFFLPLHNLLLFFTWLLILRLSNSTNSHFLQISAAMSLFFVVTHALIVLALLTSAGVKFHLRDNGIQAKRLCYWCLMSTVLVIIFLPALGQTSDDIGTIDRNLATIIFECVSIATFQQFGTSPLCSFIVFIASILSVIAMISTSLHNSFWAIFACVILLGEYLVYASSTLQHLDYKHRYSQILEFEKSVSNKMMLTVQELTSTLSRFDEAITIIAPEIMFEKSNSDDYSSWRWIKEAAVLQVQRYHVLGFKHTVSETSNEVDYSGETRFGFYKTCRTIFAMLETSAGFALPLFLDEDKHEVYITGQRDIFEIMIFLLIYESVYLNRAGFCRISCENDSEVI